MKRLLRALCLLLLALALSPVASAARGDDALSAPAFPSQNREPVRDSESRQYEWKKKSSDQKAAAPVAVKPKDTSKRLRFVTTLRPAVILTLGGVSQRAPLANVLSRMAEGDMRGTFMVTERELQRNPGNLDLIASHGQDFGVAIRTTEKDDYASISGYIGRVSAALRERYGIEAQAVRLMGGPETDDLRRACADRGLLLLGQGLNIVQSKHKDATSVEQVMPEIFGKWTTSLNRGEIIFLRTDFYHNNDALAGDLLLEIKRRKVDNIAYRTTDDSPETNFNNDSAYAVTDLRTVLDDTAERYTLPVDVSQLPEFLRPDYRPFAVTDENFREQFLKRYIGSPLVDETDRMVGFHRSDMLRADKTGLVYGVAPRTIFLTFDDWGMDDSINPILYVLRKHGVTGTFFVITWNMPNNPNLLRAIAADGHDIGSHTNGHKAMATRTPSGKQVVAVNPEEYAEDVREGYRRLAATIGDVVRTDGSHVLTRLMRPPTLAVSAKPGVRDLLEAGYTFIVNGYESTEDYAQPGLQSLIGALHDGVYMKSGKIRDGAIMVMHMSQTARHTAQALDILLTTNELRPDGDPKKFLIGRLSDYLTEDYDQCQRKVPLRKIR